ncbi:MAG TPA: nuclear transport factor 2 family protein [Blastococcus sp.]|jgi:ketosteroid isomerase-like protein|nr:nuclear transport factor 2 family protein [Blastococcus sp.]
MNATIAKLRTVMNAHDAEGMAALFAPEYHSEQPAHPNRAFDGHIQVEARWREMFREVPDLVVEVVSEVTVGSTSWVEWIWRGHRTDGSVFDMRGTTVLGLTRDGLIAEARQYMEPVDHAGAVEDPVQQLSTPSS